MKTKGKKANPGSEEVGVRERIMILYDNLVSLVADFPDTITTETAPEMKRLRRLIQYIIDMVIDDEPIVLGMALNSNRYDYAKRHPVNVCILTVRLGHHIGLSKKELVDLGIVALLYDICLPFVPREVREKTGAYTDEDWHAMEQHTIEGFRMLFELEDLDERIMRAAIVAYEHHMRYDMSGYPKPHHLPSQDFYTRMIGVAEWYDALTSSRCYAQKGRSPDYAVKVMLEKAGTELDPTLVRIFISMMGVYPVGSVVVLDSGEIGIVKRPHLALIKRPRVIVISGEVKPFVADLSKRGEDGRYLRTVKRTLDPNEYGIDYSSYFFSSHQRSGQSAKQ
jgi:HD-GYP domain-containing protein (c-di-GMP phosphodiesterase class II)